MSTYYVPSVYSINSIARFHGPAVLVDGVHDRADYIQQHQALGWSHEDAEARYERFRAGKDLSFEIEDRRGLQKNNPRLTAQ